MKTITMATAERIWKAHREIQVGLKLIADVEKAIAEGGDADPYNHTHRGYPAIAASVIMAHIDQARMEVEAGTKAAIAEALGEVESVAKASHE